MKKFLNLLGAYFAGSSSVFAIANFLAGNWLMATLESLIVIAMGIGIAFDIKNGDL